MNRPLTLFLCGDIMTGRGIDQVLPHSCPPHLYEPNATSALDYVALAERAHGPIPRPMAYADLWGEALRVLERARPDARIVNLETSITLSENAEPKGINYRMHPDNVLVLTAAGVGCCVLANNHMLDWGLEGLEETLRTLRGTGVRVAGAGNDLAAASAPAALAVNGGGARVLVFGFGTRDSGIPDRWGAEPARPGVRLLRDLSTATVEQIAREVTASRRPGDLVVASIHWGPNWGFDIPRSQRRFAQALVDAGAADVVHGHSSHHPKAIEIYRERLILYGCGDFLNDYEGIGGYGEFRGDLVLMYLPAFDPAGRLARLELVPLQIRGFRLRRPSAGDRAWLRRALDRECRRFGHHLAERDDSFLLE
jgi:poly-gamma-glutamate synthesis protein (capsule biosynthesis protein)